jgi:penicillin amidase
MWHLVATAFALGGTTRDAYGVPHIRSPTDAGAFYALGEATAQDRPYQLLAERTAGLGRMAEFFGPGTGGANVASDVSARTLGFSRYAQRAADAMNPADRALLDAFAAGVSAQLAQAGPPELAVQYALPAHNWSASDSLLVWHRFAVNFAPSPFKKADGLAQAEALAAQVGWAAALTRLRCGASNHSGPCRPLDPQGVSIEEADADPAWLGEARAFASAHYTPGAAAPSSVWEATSDAERPAFSHGWAAGRAALGSNGSVLHGDPQVPLQLPSALYEWHMQGATFEARGAGVVGGAQILVGSGRRVAWTLTAMALDQADVFKLQTDAARPGEYQVDGRWRAFENTSIESVRVRGGATVDVRCADTLFGRVVTDLVAAAASGGGHERAGSQGGAQWALLAVPYVRPAATTFAASLALARAPDLGAAVEALGAWEFPSGNFLLADDAGSVAYRATGANPVRARDAPLGGSIAWYGNATATLWQPVGVVPPHLNPSVVDPSSGYVLSGNNRPAGGWYPIPMLNVAAGDSDRSRRVRELLAAARPLTAAHAHAMHWDTTFVSARDVARLAVAAAPLLGSDVARAAVPWLQSWLADTGGAMDVPSPAAAVAWRLAPKLRASSDARSPVNKLVDRFGGGTVGALQFMLRNTTAELPACCTPGLTAWLTQTLEALNASMVALGPPGPAWGAYVAARQSTTLPLWRESIGARLDFDPAGNGTALAATGLRDMHGSTVLSQGGQCYSQTVLLGNVLTGGVPGAAAAAPTAVSLLPVGQAEEPTAAHFADQEEMWRRALEMKPSGYFLV